MTNIKECTLSTADLIAKSKEWVSSLAKTGGQSWTLQVPVNFNKDPDMLIIELCNRLEEAQGCINISSLLPLYQQWCKETKRNGAVLVGGSINEFFNWLNSR